MKKIIVVLLFMLFLSACVAQKNTVVQKQTKDYILFSGTIANAPSKKFMLSGKSGPITISLDENGSFSDTLKTGTAHYILYDSSNRLDFYFIKGGEYNLKADLKNFKSTAILSGTDLDASNYLMTKIEHIQKERGDYTAFNSLNESDFKTKATKLYETNVAYLKSFPNIPKDFVDEELQELEYYHLLTLAKYQGLYRMNTKQPNFKVSADFRKELDKVDYLNDNAYKAAGSYDDLVSLYFNDKAVELAENEGINKYFAKLKVFGAIPNENIKNSLLGVGIRDIAYVDNKKEYYDAFVAVSTLDSNNEKLKGKFEILKLQEKGRPSPVFTNYTNHAGGTTSLSDFKGKYVYIDVWATWCAPCNAEIPFLKSVEKQYHGKKIVFVSISIDVEKKYDAWRKMVVAKEMSGVQLLADKDWKSDFVTGYEIHGIPRFILIGPDGNIVDADAPRPSDPKLVTLLNGLGI